MVFASCDLQFLLTIGWGLSECSRHRCLRSRPSQLHPSQQPCCMSALRHLQSHPWHQQPSVQQHCMHSLSLGQPHPSFALSLWQQRCRYQRLRELSCLWLPQLLSNCIGGVRTVVVCPVGLFHNDILGGQALILCSIGCVRCLR
uniref:Uncharacterized protein n=1 Tax=Physcomitrium patens TaxID=3218 RepID=A0A2K1L9C3_PHYPA|nr:hypothetical protein PHYPA_001061 [Physcomitrium patens]